MSLKIKLVHLILHIINILRLIIYLLILGTDDGKLMADADAGEFWGFFGGFAPLPRRTVADDGGKVQVTSAKLLG